MSMGLLVKCVVLALAAVLLSDDLQGGGGGGASAMGLPPPPPAVNFSIGVQGMVWCKTCRYSGYNEPMDASPLAGAVAVLRCKHGRKEAAVLRGVTDKTGYFLIQSSQMASYTITDCKVAVRRSPADACGVPVHPSRRKDGLPLKFDAFVQRGDGLQGLYSVGNFLFRPKNPNSCR